MSRDFIHVFSRRTCACRAEKFLFHRICYGKSVMTSLYHQPVFKLDFHRPACPDDPAFQVGIHQYDLRSDIRPLNLVIPFPLYAAILSGFLFRPPANVFPPFGGQSGQYRFQCAEIAESLSLTHVGPVLWNPISPQTVRLSPLDLSC